MSATPALKTVYKDCTPEESLLHRAKFQEMLKKQKAAQAKTTQAQPTQPLKAVGPDLYELTVPARFWWDHVERCELWDLDACEISQTSKGILVHLNMDQIHNLHSDADYYEDAAKEMGPEYLGLISSARATLKRLAKFGVTA